MVDYSYDYPDAKLKESVHTGGTKNTARITIFPENEFKAQLLRYRTDIKTEISVVSTEILVKPIRKIRPNFAT